jgi:hypothetical protein
MHRPARIPGPPAAGGGRFCVDGSVRDCRPVGSRNLAVIPGPPETAEPGQQETLTQGVGYASNSATD